MPRQQVRASRLAAGQLPRLTNGAPTRGSRPLPCNQGRLDLAPGAGGMLLGAGFAGLAAPPTDTAARRKEAHTWR
jgi:hypothetical protein